MHPHLLHVLAGQVLVYREHRAPGLFVLLEGAVDLGETRNGGRHRQDARRRGPFMLPSLDRLGEPMDETLTIAEDAELLFVPGTLVQSDARVRSLLEGIEPR